MADGGVSDEELEGGDGGMRIERVLGLPFHNFDASVPFGLS
jgi:hypothetical protein